MRLGIKGKQVLGVTALVAVVVVVLSLVQLARLATVELEEARARAELVANAVYHRAREVVAEGVDPQAGLRADGGVRAIIESGLYSKGVTFVAIADVGGIAVVHADRAEEGRPIPPGDDLVRLTGESALAQLRAVYLGPGRTIEFRQPLRLGEVEFGSIRIGMSSLLVRRDLEASVQPALVAALVALTLSVVVALLLAQRLLRPIHVINSGLARLGHGEFGVHLDLSQADELGDLGSAFNEVSARLSASRGTPAGRAGEQAEPEPATVSPGEAREDDTLRYARKLAALGRLSAGVAHEVKNPLNAMLIHLELLRQQVGPRGAGGDGAGPHAHIDVIESEVKRLDEVMQGFLKFTRPEELRLEVVSLATLFDEMARILRPEADRAGVVLTLEAGGAPDVAGDSALLKQAFLNLALNACQAMPSGGSLRLAARAARGRRVEVTVTDTGVGIAPEHLQKIFNLYFTTREKGSGIGLSMVFRTVQLHDGEIEVQSTPGVGTTFTVWLPMA